MSSAGPGALPPSCRRRAAHGGSRGRAPVLVICPGGIDGQGGIARHVRSTHRAWTGDPPLIVVDSHGLTAFALCAARLLARAATRRVSLVHVHMAADGSVVRKLLLARLAGWFGVPVIVHVHGSRFADFVAELGPLPRGMLSCAMRRAEAVVALGQSAHALLTGTLSLDPARVHVLPNAVAIPPAAPPPVHDECRIAFLGRVGARKGVPELLAALARLDRPDARWRATIAGDGEVAAFRACAATMGLSERIAWTGWLDAQDAAALLAGSDLLVLPSHNEGLPMAILEAMAAGLPVIAGGVGAIPELIRDGDNGVLVPPGDVDALERALSGLISDRHARRRMGRAARATVVAGYDVDAYVRRLSALYASLIPGRPLAPVRADAPVAPAAALVVTS